MNSLRVLGCALTALGTPSSPADAPASPDQRTIEILVAGPEDARNRLVAALQPLLATIRELRWVTQATLPPQDPLAASNDPGPAHLWIDLSNPAQVVVYLPQKASGGMAARILPRAGTGADEVDPMTSETAAQIVKASVIALHELPERSGEAGPAPVAENSPSLSPPPVHRHDGLYVRLRAGLVYLRTRESYLTADVYKGFGPMMDVAVGRSIVGNLILYGEVAMATFRNADEDVDGTAVVDYGTTGRDLLLLGVGPGAAYYLGSNLYVSGTLVFSKLWFLDANTDNPPPDTNWGIGGSVAVGKEWWLSRHWGMGVALQLGDTVMTHHLVSHALKTPQDVFPSMNAMTFALMMSATYN